MLPAQQDTGGAVSSWMRRLRGGTCRDHVADDKDADIKVAAVSTADIDREAEDTHVVRQPVVIVSAMIFVIMSSDLMRAVAVRRRQCGGRERILTA